MDSYFSFGWVWGTLITGFSIWLFGVVGFVAALGGAFFVLLRDLWKEAWDEDLP